MALKRKETEVAYMVSERDAWLETKKASEKRLSEVLGEKSALTESLKKKEAQLVRLSDGHSEEQQRLASEMATMKKSVEEWRRKSEELEKEQKEKADEVVRLRVENESLKESLKKQDARIQDLEKNKLTTSQLERVKMIVEEKKGLKKKLKEKEAEIVRLTQQLTQQAAQPSAQQATGRKVETNLLPRNTKIVKEDGDDTRELVKEANRMKDKLQNIKPTKKELPKNVSLDLRTSVPSSSKKRTQTEDIAGSRKRVEEDPETEKSCQTQ